MKLAEQDDPVHGGVELQCWVFDPEHAADLVNKLCLLKNPVCENAVSLSIMTHRRPATYSSSITQIRT